MILTTIGKLTLAMGLGYYLKKRGIFDDETDRKLSLLVMNFCLPLMILTAMNGNQNAERGEVLGFMLIGAALYLILPFAGKALSLLLGVKREERPVYELFFVFANVTFIGYPVAASLYGEDCIFYISVFNLLFNIMIYTYGAKKVNQNQGEGSGKGLRSVLSNGTVMSVLAVTMFFLDLHLPEGAAEVCNFMGDLAAPVAILVTGSTIGSYSVRELLTENKKLYLMSAIRMILIPIGVYWLMTFLGFSGELRGIATITMGMPVASAVGMSCVEYGNFVRLGPSGVALSTILSLVTIPFLLGILA